jgi:site-specific DNA-methyltransferase (adenine-specific)
MDEKNKLYFGDNLKILREYVPEASVDLIYLDPPFNSSATYNGGFAAPFVAPTFRSAQSDAHLKVGATPSGEESAAQITAFEDTWQWGRESEAVYREIVERGPRKLADLMQASGYADRMQRGHTV